MARDFADRVDVLERGLETGVDGDAAPAPPGESGRFGEFVAGSHSCGEDHDVARQRVLAVEF
jgi:hypothetical protein